MKKEYAEPKFEVVELSGNEQIFANSPCTCDFCDNSIGIECVNCVYDE